MLENTFLPGVEKVLRFKSEGDVVNASSIYITNPVHVALQLVQPTDTCLSEVTRPGKDGSNSGSSRADKVYFKGPPSDEARPGLSENAYAVLEFKSHSGLPVAEFKKGIVKNYNDYAQATYLGSRPKYLPQVNENAFILLKQATHYAGRFNTPFIALCDYKTLVLLVMSKVEGIHAGPVSAPLIYIYMRYQSIIG